MSQLAKLKGIAQFGCKETNDKVIWGGFVCPQTEFPQKLSNAHCWKSPWWQACAVGQAGIPLPPPTQLCLLPWLKVTIQGHKET